MSRGKFIALIASAAVPAFVLVLAGIAKLNDPYLAGLFLNSTLNVPLTTAFTLARILAVFEIVAGTALVACVARSVIPALAAIGLYAVFVGLLIRLLVSHRYAATCGCFGDLFSGAGQHHLAAQCSLDIVLMTLLVIHLLIGHRAAAPRPPPDGVSGSDGSASVGGWHGNGWPPPELGGKRGAALAIRRGGLRRLRAYVGERVAMMDYPACRAKGWDLGSGPTEAQCKTMTARLKGSGMRWDPPNAAAMLALSGLADSDEWSAYWHSQGAQWN